MNPAFILKLISGRWAFAAFLLFLLSGIARAQGDFDPLLDSLERTIEKAPSYIEQKENTIQALMRQATASSIFPEAKFRFYGELLNSYRSYRFDSAFKYVNIRIGLAKEEQRHDWQIESELQLCGVLISAGMYLEAYTQLQSVNPSGLSREQLKNYFHEKKLIFESLRDYSQDFKYAPGYARQARQYQDSLLTMLNPASFDFRIEKAIQLMSEGRLDQAEPLLTGIFKHDLVAGTSTYAGITAIMADLYRMKGDSREERKFRIYSAIADIQAVVKENRSLTELAVSLYGEGEVERANAFIAYAMADANFFNARQRKIEIAKIYPIITKAYQIESKRQEERLRTFIWIISGITLLLAISIFIVLNQKRKLSKAREYLQELNMNLNEVNESIRSQGEKLREANFIKEEYIGQFLNQCSLYIDKLESFQKRVYKLLMAKQFNELQKLSESNELVKSELAEFYRNFDKAFLSLFPEFVQQFNRLLVSESPVILKKGEMLNTELRIFALIRLGITDSHKIAQFLRYSPNTIYNYRAQIKNRAVSDRENFERRVMQLEAQSARN
jgi:hypothetical protein